MKEYGQNNEEDKNILREDPEVYYSREELEEARLREAIDRTPAEKFRFLMTLMKMNNTMRKAVIHHKKGI